MIAQNEITDIFTFLNRVKLMRPLIGFRVAAGFPSPAEDYIENAIDLNKDLILHPAATFYVRTIGDSMEPEICQNELLVVDRAVDVKSGDIIVARIGDDMCVKEYRETASGEILLISANQSYQPITVTEEMDFEIWGKVLWSIRGH